MSGNTTVWSSNKGDVSSLDGIVMGAGTPAAGTFTSVSSNTTVLTGGLVASVTGITAGTTHTLAGAVPLTGAINVVTVCATSADAVSLPSASAALVGSSILVFNNGAAAAAVWPLLADKIDGGTAGAAVVLTNAKRCEYYCTAVNNWVSAQLGVVSA